MPNTVHIHRVFAAPRERVYRAFLEPDAIVKWNAPNGFTCRIHHHKAEPGGTFKMSFINFGTGQTHTFGGEFLELVENERIVSTDKFDDPNVPGEMKVTVELREVSCGTDVMITQEGLPDAIPVDHCHLGWQESLDLLSRLVEPDIPDEM